MPQTETSPRTVRLMTALLLVAMFAAGTATGVGLCRWMAPGHPPPHSGPAFGPLPLEELGLTAEQRDKTHEILERHRPELDAILHESFPKVRAVNDQIEREIREVLTPEQRAQLDQAKARRPPPPGPPPPGPPPGPWPPAGHPPPFGMPPPSPPPSATP